MCEYRNKYFGRGKSLLGEIIPFKKKVHHADFAFYLQSYKSYLQWRVIYSSQLTYTQRDKCMEQQHNKILALRLHYRIS